MMQNFHSTFILCFLGFLLTQAQAFPSWKSCSAHSDCEATDEYCEKISSSSNECSYCAFSTEDDSVDSSVPTWCTDDTYFESSIRTSLTSSSVLTYVKQGGWQNDVSLCPSFDACTKSCRKEYKVEKTDTQITLTSTFADTTDCACDKVVFTLFQDDDDNEWKTSSTNFGTSADSVDLWQYSTDALDINIWHKDVTPVTVDCVWQYSIGTSSSPAATLTGLFGLISASVAAFVLV